MIPIGFGLDEALELERLLRPGQVALVTFKMQSHSAFFSITDRMVIEGCKHGVSILYHEDTILIRPGIDAY